MPQSPASRQTKASEELYFRLKEELGTGVIVEHKKYGEGVVTQLDDRACSYHVPG